MPISEAPAEVKKAKEPADPGAPSDRPARESSITGSILGLDTFSERDLVPLQPPEPRESPSPALRGSRWADYETHELLEMISELEDERRWSRLREGFWLALLLHILFFSAITWIPTYIFRVPKVIDPFEAIKERKDLTYLDLPPDAVRKTQPRVVVKPLPKQPLIDKKTLDELNRESPPPPAAQQQVQSPEQPKPQAAQPVPPTPESQAQVEAPRPTGVPAKPNFAMGSQNPADQLREDMRKAMQGKGQENYGQAPSGGLPMHPGAGGGVQILSDTQGVDFNSWLARWHYITEHTWDPLIPDEVNPPILKQGVVVIHFKVLPNGQVVDMQLDGRSGDTGLDRAAWGAITGSSYPSLPREFHGPYLELRAYFLYNMEPPRY